LEEDRIKGLEEMVFALTRERLENPPGPKRRIKSPARGRYEASFPLVTFRIDIALRDRINEWRDEDNVSPVTIMKLGLERLEQVKLVNVLMNRISQKEESP
jgi:hypothetical protein